MTDTSVFTAIFYEPQKYKEGVLAGFAIFPRTKDQPTGWGEPYFSDSGAPIWPGTEGGPNANRVFGLDAIDGWKMKRSKYFQVAGAIDWWGDWKDPVKKNKRKVLSVNGPAERYWNPNGAFVYESDPRNWEIYMDGKIAGVAPDPVLGACLTTWDKPTEDGSGTNKETLIIAICKSGANDVAYCRPYTGLTTKEDMTDAARFLAMQFQSDTNPNGWVVAGNFSPPDGMVAPDTPWFFSMDGLTGRCMRRQSMTFNDEEGTPKTQYQYVELLFAFTPSGRVGYFDYTDPNVGFRPYTYTEHCTKTQPDWTDPIPDQFGIQHTWQEDWLIASVSQNGRMKVAVDWSVDKSTWVYAWFDVFSARRMEQYWTTGTDAPAAPHSNYQSHTGTRYPPSNVPQPGDHTETVWLGVRELHSLLIGTDPASPDLKLYTGWGVSGTKTLAETGTDSFTTDPWFYFWDSLDVYVHHLDLRTSLVAGFIRLDELILPQDGPNVGLIYQYQYEEVEYANVHNSELWDTDSFFTRFTAPITEYALPFFGWDRATMQSWPATFDVSSTVTDYQGAWSTANDDGHLFQPVLKTFLYGTIFTGLENTYLRKRTVDDSLTHATHNHRDGQFSSAENDTHLVAYEYVDPNDNEKKQANRLYPTAGDPDIGTIVMGGDTFWGGGTI